MNTQNVKLNSELIAPFMRMRKGMTDYHSKSDGQYECFYDDAGLFGDPRQTYTDYSLAFDTSWNWLMKVVEKIKRDCSNGILSIIIENDGCHIKMSTNKQFIYEFYSGFCDTEIESVYKAVNKFIEWYNTQK